MLSEKTKLQILTVNVIAVTAFTISFIYRENYEFLIYIGVILFFMVLILSTLKKTKFSNTALWGLTIWAILHMSGGGLSIGGTRLYEIILLNISEQYEIFKFDQFVHIYGFAVATLVVYELLKPKLKPNPKHWVALSIVIIMAGLGLGALNEIIEFFATVTMKETGVGGYTNTSLDLVSNLIGAILAMIYIRKTNY